MKVTKRWVCICTDWHKRRGDSYDFKTNRIDTPEKLVAWIHHLTEKCWFDRVTCRQLIDAVCYHFGWKPHKWE